MSKRSGYTFFELMIVIGVAIIFGSVALLNLPTGLRTKLEIDNAINNLKSHLILVQQRAISQENGSRWGIHLDTSISGQHFYQIFYGDSYETGIVVETVYLPDGIIFLNPSDGNTEDIIFEKVTGWTEDGHSIVIGIESVEDGAYDETNSENLVISEGTGLIEISPSVPQFDISLNTDPDSGTVQPGGSIDLTVRADITAGIPEPVVFSAENLPSGVIASFDQAGCVPTCSTPLNLQTSENTPNGNHFISISAVSGGLTKTAVFPLSVNFQSVPGIPEGFSAVGGNAKVSLSWQTPTFTGGSSINNYRVYRSTVPGNETYIGDAGVSLSYVDSGLVNGTVYYYKVSAVNSVGEGSQSGEANALSGAYANNVSGYAWSQNVGWLSFNCMNEGSCNFFDYGVRVDPETGYFSGNAWSQSAGWVSFDEDYGCPATFINPNCKARVSGISTGTFPKQVAGWAKLLSTNSWMSLAGGTTTVSTGAKSPMPTGRYGHDVAVIDGKIYVFGGNPSSNVGRLNQKYDPVSDTWESKALPPTSRALYVSAAAKDGSGNDKIYVIGGTVTGAPAYTTSAIVEEYNPVSDTWTAKTSMPTSRDGSAAATVNDKIYVLGGETGGTQTIYNINEMYNPTTNSWTTLAAMPETRMDAGAAAAIGADGKDKIYVIGGWGGGASTARNTVFEYDVTSNTWSVKAPMPTARYDLILVTINNKIHAIGGGAETNVANVNEVYDPVTNTWSVKASTYEGRSSSAGAAAEGQDGNDKIYVFGGNGSANFSSVEEYDPGLDRWTGVSVARKSPMPNGRNGHGAAVVANKVYVFGGNPSSNVGRLNQKYDPVSDTWESKALPPTSRALYVSAAAKDGSGNDKIYVIGGTVTGAPAYTTSAIVEEYNPVSDTWTAKTSMPTSRDGSAAATVNDKIYVLGGETGGTQTIYNINEMYNPTTNSWTTLAAMPETRMDAGAAAAIGADGKDKIYVIGGWGGGASTARNTVFEYDVTSNTWSVKAPMPTARYDLILVTINNKIHAIGGGAETNVANVNEVYDPVTNTWSVKASTYEGRSSSAGAAAEGQDGNDKIYVFGGNGSANFSSVEEYDPGLDRWIGSATQNLITTFAYGVQLESNGDFSGYSWEDGALGWVRWKDASYNVEVNW